jgi:hypothetical protein
MSGFGERIGNALHWEQVERRTYVLLAGTDPVARLAWLTECGSLARGECAGREWTFKRMGFFRPYITVRVPGTPVDLATMRNEHRATKLIFADGRSYTWSRIAPLGRERCFLAATGRAVVAFAPERRGRMLRGSMTVDASAPSDEMVALLALLGWYRLVLDQMDDEAAELTAVIAATSAATC